MAQRKGQAKTTHTPTPARTRALALAGLLVLLAIPRIARLAYPQIWIEDESYLNGAFMLSRGFMPYRDFPLPHFPALDALLASVFLVAPISIRTAEVVTQLATFAGSVLVFTLGRRLGDPLSGGCGALVFATSALLFRYHVFEREVFLVVPILCAVLLASRPAEGGRETRAALGAGLLIFVAITIKLTAIAALFALALQLQFDGRRRSAVIMACTAVAALGVTALALVSVFGRDFIVQVVLFRAVHAAFPSWGVKLDEVRYTMDIGLALGIWGLALVLWNGQRRRWIGPLLQLLCGFVILLLLNPTFWAHTGIELLPWLSLGAGYLLANAVRSLAPAGARRRPRTVTARLPPLTCVVGAILFLYCVAPIRNLNWEAGDGSVYGFGYRDRRELETVAQFVRTHAAPEARVATPPIIAFIANRREVVPYAEVAGEIDELTTIVRRDGYVAALTNDALRGRSFWESVEASRDRSMPALEAALAAHQVAVVINDSPDDLMPVPLTNVSTEGLEAYGYRLASGSAHYEAWIPR